MTWSHPPCQAVGNPDPCAVQDRCTKAAGRLILKCLPGRIQEQDGGCVHLELGDHLGKDDIQCKAHVKTGGNGLVDDSQSGQTGELRADL